MHPHNEILKNKKMKKTLLGGQIQRANVLKGHWTQWSAVPTQDVQGALVVGDDDIGSLRLKMLPAADLESKAQQVLNMADQAADDPEGGMKEWTALH